MPEVIGPVRPKVPGAFKVIDAADLGGIIPEAQIHASIMRDAEFTATAVRSLLGLGASEVNDLLTGATLVGQILTFIQNDGTTVPITIPTATPGTGDGVVQSGAFNSDGTTLVLTLDTGGTVEVDVPELLRATGTSTDQTARDAAAAAQSEIDAHEISTHNEDATARANAASAQTAADNAQTEVTTHAASPHNTDQIARDGVSTAQQAANAAGTVAMDANAAAVTAAQSAADAETTAADAEQRAINNATAFTMHELNHGRAVDVRLTGFPDPSADTVGRFYDDGTHLKFGIDEDIHSIDPVGTFSAVAVATPYLGEFTSRAALNNAHRPGETTIGRFAWVWGSESGVYRLAENNGIRGYVHDTSDTAVQADLDRLPGNDAGDSVWLGHDRQDVGALSELASIDAMKKYYYGNTRSALAGIRLLDNTTFVAGTLAHKNYLLTDVFTGHNPQPDRAVVFDGHGRPEFHPDFVGQFAINQAGAVWVGGFELVDHSTDPSWTAANLADVSWNRFEGVSVSGGDPQNIGGFYYRTHTARFHVVDQQFNSEDLTWSGLIDLYRAHNEIVGNPPAGLVPLSGQKSIFLSGPHIAFADDNEAAAHVAAQQISDPTTTVFLWFVGERGDESNWTFRWATSGGWVAGVTDITENLFWNGPFEVDGTGGEGSITTVVGGFNRSVLKAKNADPARMDRFVRHQTLTTSLANINDDDDIEFILETGGVSTGSLDLAFTFAFKIPASLIKTRVASTLTADFAITSSNQDFIQADKGKYIPLKIDRGNSDDLTDFAHETLWIGRVNNTTLCMWTANAIPETQGTWAFVTVNRVQYQTDSGEQQLGTGSVGGHYFNAFYQQAAVKPAFNGVPVGDGTWTGLGDWEISRSNAVDASSTDTVWIAYASGYVDENDVVYVNTPQVFAEFATQYSNDGFSTITGVAPTDPEGWWRRDILPGGGFTAPIPLFHTDNPWIPVWAEEDFYTRNDDGESKDIDLNLNNVTAIRFTLTPFGLWSDDGIPQRPGAICTDVMPRPPVGWSTTDFNDNSRADTGIYSVSYHESAGLQVHHQNDGSAADFNIPIGAYRATNYPARAWACALKFIAPNTNDMLQLTALRIFASSQHYERFLWTIEVQRES